VSWLLYCVFLYTQGKRFDSKMAWANRKEGDRVRGPAPTLSPTHIQNTAKVWNQENMLHINMLHINMLHINMLHINMFQIAGHTLLTPPGTVVSRTGVPYCLSECCPTLRQYAASLWDWKSHKDGSGTDKLSSEFRVWQLGTFCKHNSARMPVTEWHEVLK
jgi:hypothetical protein